MKPVVSRRKPFEDRVLTNRTRSPRFRAGTKANKKQRDVPTFASDRRKA